MIDISRRWLHWKNRPFLLGRVRNGPMKRWHKPSLEKWLGIWQLAEDEDGGEGWIKKQEWLENWVAKEEDALEMWYAKSSARNWSFSLSAAAKLLQSCPTLCNPIDGSPSGSLSLGFSRQEHWSGLPFPSPMHKSKSEVAQSCLTFSDPMDCSLPGSSIHGIFQARVLEWGAIATLGILWDILMTMVR